MVTDTAASPIPQSKRIVICLDGTGNQIGAGNLTNVAKLFGMLAKDHSSQLTYYDPGVGTLAPANGHSAIRRNATLLVTRAVGGGLEDNVAQAYRYLMQHWRPGDSVYIFGFSRGAYTARALAGMLLRPGLIRPGSENLLPYAVEKYAINRDFKPDEYVGGTFMPDHRLATIALKWVVDGAVGELAVNDASYQQQCRVTEDFAHAPIHDNGLLWALTGRRRRPIPSDGLVHPSVLVRRYADPAYLPNLSAEQLQNSSQQPGQPDWTTPALELAEGDLR